MIGVGREGSFQKHLLFFRVNKKVGKEVLSGKCIEKYIFISDINSCVKTISYKNIILLHLSEFANV